MNEVIKELMGFIVAYAFMGLLLIWQQLSHRAEKKQLLAEVNDLRNRLMARTLTEYAGATRALTLAAPEVEQELTDQEKEQIMDRIPIN